MVLVRPIEQGVMMAIQIEVAKSGKEESFEITEDDFFSLLEHVCRKENPGISPEDMRICVYQALRNWKEKDLCERYLSYESSPGEVLIVTPWGEA
jgi:hypothetical protein